MVTLNLPVVCLTCDKYLWAVQPFSYLFSRHFPSANLTIVGFQKPDFPLAARDRFISLAPREYASNRWSDGLIQYLESQSFDHFILMLEDYWLARTVDEEAVMLLHEYVSLNPDILRMDLTSDRIHEWQGYAPPHIIDYYGRIDIVQSLPGSPYMMSLQAAIWNRKLLLSLLTRGRDSWHVELFTSVPDSMRVTGTYQCPMRYANIVYKGEIMGYEVEKLCTDDRSVVVPMLPKDWKAIVPEYK